MTRACKNCQWWVSAPASELGVCKGGPPTPAAKRGEWPVTHHIDWCGAFRLAERMAGGISDADFEDAGKRMAELLATVGKGNPQ